MKLSPFTVGSDTRGISRSVRCEPTQVARGRVRPVKVAAEGIAGRLQQGAAGVNVECDDGRQVQQSRLVFFVFFHLIMTRK